MAKAVFLDRDGVINRNVYNDATGEWESPLHLKDFELFPWAIECLQQLQAENFNLFLVSNQPSYAKGKTTLENLKAINEKLHTILIENQILFKEYYYCYHHPQGIVPDLSVVCNCRKPGTFFLEEAKKNYPLDMSMSWMIGDRDTDIICGQTIGIKTIMIVNQKEPQRKNNMACTPDFTVANLPEAVKIILGKEK